MMKQEFEKLTGMAVTFEEYRDIEERYMAFDGDKQAFAKAFLDADGPARVYYDRAKTIETLRDCLAEQSKAHRREVEALEAQLADVKKELDKLLEWQPATKVGTNQTQADYEKLAAAGREMTDEEALKLVVEETGFSPERVVIIREVARYEVNKLHQLRKAETFTRTPVYEATDWNYVRVDVRGCATTYQWELVDGQLWEYNS